LDDLTIERSDELTRAVRRASLSHGEPAEGGGDDLALHKPFRFL